MLVIRLSRIGKKKAPMYRLTIMEKARDTYGRALEILGSYNPFSKELEVKEDRIKYWLSVGAQMSPTVNNLLVEKKIIDGKKVTASKKGTPKEAESPADTGAGSEQKTDGSQKVEAPVKEAAKEEDKKPEATAEKQVEKTAEEPSPAEKSEDSK